MASTVEIPVFHPLFDDKFMNIKKSWLSRICHSLDMKVHKLLHEEIQGKTVNFIKDMSENPDTVRERIPDIFMEKVITEHAIPWKRFQNIFKWNPLVNKETQELIHCALEAYLYRILYEAAIELKQKNKKIIHPLSVHLIHKKYIPPEETEDEGSNDSS